MLDERMELKTKPKCSDTIQIILRGLFYTLGYTFQLKFRIQYYIWQSKHFDLLVQATILARFSTFSLTDLNEI